MGAPLGDRLTGQPAYGNLYLSAGVPFRRQVGETRECQQLIDIIGASIYP